MKLKYVLIPVLLFCTAPQAHAGPPAKKIIQKILGVADEVDAPKTPKLPDLPSRPPTASQPSGSSAAGSNPGILDNLDDLTPPKPRYVPGDSRFKDVSKPVEQGGDPSVLPVDINNGTDIEVKPPVLKDGPTGVKDRQEVIIRPTPKTLVDYMNSFGFNLPELPKNAKPRVTLINHSYYEGWEPNFKIEVKVGDTTYTVGFIPVPGKSPGIPNFRDGGITFPEGAFPVDKDWYNAIIAAGEAGVNGYRKGPGGIIQRFVDGKWVDYMNPHWPYR